MKDMTLNGDQSGLTRRQLLGLATLTTAGLAAGSVGVPQAKAVPKAGEQREPIEDFKHDLEGSEGWVGEGGSAKESTVKQLPVATSIAGVSMRLKPGGLRELHWHAIAAEWAYVVKGTVRTTVISPNGNGEAAQDDFGPGDVWFFPKDHGHALQGVGPGETHFVLGFDDGYFSEFGTFSITDWIGHTPSNALSQNLGIPESTYTNFPKTEVYIMQGHINGYAFYLRRNPRPKWTRACDAHISKNWGSYSQRKTSEFRFNRDLGVVPCCLGIDNKETNGEFW
jgi:oxalate decarboxylase